MPPRHSATRRPVIGAVALAAGTVLTACGRNLPEQANYVPPAHAVAPRGPAATEPTTPTAERTTLVGRGACSTRGVAVPAPQPRLSEPVEARRAALVEAAMACDFERVAAATGLAFTSSLLRRADDASAWRRLDREGAALAWLVRTLSLDPAPVHTSAGRWYVWPAAAAVPWSQLGDEARQALAAIYPPAALATFHRLGAFSGYRVSIGEAGVWRSFDRPTLPERP